jgi:hypothetical protein
VLLATALGLPLFDEDACPFGARPEGTSVEEHSFAWPPAATECRYTDPGGEVSTETFLPWREWAAAALLAVAVALALSAMGGASRPTGRVVSAAVSAAAAAALVFGVI